MVGQDAPVELVEWVRMVEVDVGVRHENGTPCGCPPCPAVLELPGRGEGRFQFNLPVVQFLLNGIDGIPEIGQAAHFHGGTSAASLFGHPPHLQLLQQQLRLTQGAGGK